MASPSKADTFYGVLVPMSTPVTLTATVSSLTIGTTTTLTAGGGDGTGGYRYNNNSNGFCSINGSGVVTASYPGTCAFTVTRLATGKYLDTTSNSVTLTALPEPDKSVISTPSPEPSPSQTARVIPSPTPTPTATRSASEMGSGSVSSPTEFTYRFKSITSVKARLNENGKGTDYKFSWVSDPNVSSYSVNLLSKNEKRSFTSIKNEISLDNLSFGAYTLNVQGINPAGKLSQLSSFTFTVAQPKSVKFLTSIAITSKSPSPALQKTLNYFLSRTSKGTPIKVSIEYRKLGNSTQAATVIKNFVTKYLKDTQPSSEVEVSLKSTNGDSELAVIRGDGNRLDQTLRVVRN